MNRRTHLSTLSLAGITLIILAVSMAMSATSAVATDLDDSLRAYAKHEVACYVFAQAAGIPYSEVHAGRIALHKLEKFDISYIVGYQTATLDFQAQLLSKDEVWFKVARIVVAKKLYKTTACTTVGVM